MSPDTPVERALAAADAPIWLESAAQVARAAKAWRRSAALGLDTEFVRERTYHANLGLVQISDGNSVWLLDPLVDGALPPLAELLADPGIVKIFHSPSEDLEVLLHVTGEVPDPLIDTQLACAMLGEPLQLGFHTAVEKLFGIAVDKGLTRSNWLARPLRPELLHYAALDVCVLPLMREQLGARLEAMGRSAWLAEDCRRMVDAARSPAQPSQAWQRIRGIERLDGDSLVVLKALASWREKEARRKNRPRGFIVTDPVLVAMARHKPRQVGDLNEFSDFHPRARQRYGAAITEIVNHAVDSGKTMTPLPQVTRSEQALLNRLRTRATEVAESLGVEPTLLATRKELEQLVLTRQAPERWQGWRQDVIGTELLALASGNSEVAPVPMSGTVQPGDE